VNVLGVEKEDGHPWELCRFTSALSRGVLCSLEYETQS